MREKREIVRERERKIVREREKREIVREREKKER